MSGDFSREAFTRILGPELMARIERHVAAAPPPSPERVEKLRRIFAPAVNKLAQQRQPDMADAA